MSDVDSTSTGALSQAVPVAMTDLEAQVEAIEDVEIEMGDEGWEIPVP